GSDSTDARQSNEIKISDPKKQPDYVGKDVKPLTVEAMKKVNAEKVVSTFGAGMIQIPSINMNLPIVEGMSQENLSVGAGTMKANQELGKGNFTLAGHYMTNAGLLFGGIKNVKKNDLVQVTYKNKTMNFKVTKVKQITAEDNQVIFDSEGNGILTLITCDSSVAGTDGRLMVRCEPV
ncbi:class A sortase, partial [Enterococcus hirae]